MDGSFVSEALLMKRLTIFEFSNDSSVFSPFILDRLSFRYVMSLFSWIIVLSLSLVSWELLMSCDFNS